jgi:hypothetical protein
MKSSDLFSHLPEPEFVSNKDQFADPVQAPVFSALGDSTGDTPSSS